MSDTEDMTVYIRPQTQDQVRANRVSIEIEVPFNRLQDVAVQLFGKGARNRPVTGPLGRPIKLRSAVHRLAQGVHGYQIEFDEPIKGQVPDVIG